MDDGLGDLDCSRSDGYVKYNTHEVQGVNKRIAECMYEWMDSNIGWQLKLLVKIFKIPV